MIHQKDSLENICLFKIQMDRRVLKSKANEESVCYKCNGFNIWCSDYIKLQTQKDFEERFDFEGRIKGSYGSQ